MAAWFDACSCRVDNEIFVSTHVCPVREELFTPPPTPNPPSYQGMYWLLFHARGAPDGHLTALYPLHPLLPFPLLVVFPPAGVHQEYKSSKRARVAAPATTLEQAVFGGAAKVLGEGLYKAPAAAAFNDDGAASAGGPAWVDDDDEGLNVDVVTNPRARKLRVTEGEKALKGDVYASRLKTQFEKVG